MDEQIIGRNERFYACGGRYFFAGRCGGTSGMWYVDEIDQREINGSKTIGRVLIWRKTRTLKRKIAEIVEHEGA